MNLYICYKEIFLVTCLNDINDHARILFAHTQLTNLFTYTVTQPPINVRVTVLTPRSVEVTWTVSSSLDVTGYIISY